VSDKPRDFTLERVNRLTQAVADLMESHQAQGRNLLRVLELQGKQLAMLGEQLERQSHQMVRIEGAISALVSQVRDVASEQVLLGNRMENAFSKALQANIRLDAAEDASR
jgi:hypothetical protein